MKQYKVIERYSLESLQMWVNDDMRLGWVCQGGMMIKVDKHGMEVYYQTLVKN